MSNDLELSSDAITKSPQLLSASKLDQHLETKANPQAQRRDQHTSNQETHYDSNKRTSTAQPSGTLTGPDAFNVRSVDMSIVPKEPAAMRTSSSVIEQSIPHTKNLMDSYRPDLPPSQVAIRGSDSYKPSERSWPPPVHLVKERENFLRHAPEAEIYQYLKRNRRAICKEVTCPHWQMSDCMHGDRCLFSHEDTHAYFPSPARPAKKWTCFFWLAGRTGCPIYEEDCRFAHYDTGIYADRRGQASTMHVTCFWWSHMDRVCRKGADCLFAHHDTGILADDPRSVRRRASFERNTLFHPPNSSVRRRSDSWQVHAGVSEIHQSRVEDSPPPVCNTPQSPISPSESESEEYEPPSVRTTPPQDFHTESCVSSAHPLRPQVITESSRTVGLETATTAGNGGKFLGKPQWTAFSSSTPSRNWIDLTPNATATEAALCEATSPTTVPKQYARRTGGVKLGRTGDFRRRKPALISVEASQKCSGDRSGLTKTSVPVALTQPQNVLQPVENPGLLKCQICQKLIFVSQAASHNCPRTVNDQAGCSQQPLGYLPSSRESGMINLSQTPHSLAQNLPISDLSEQVREIDITTASKKTEYMLSRTMTDGSLPESTSHGSQGNQSGSDADAMFIPNKKRKAGPPVILRTSTSTKSLNPAQTPEISSAKRNEALATSLSILDLTELEALRKEFDVSEELQSDDDETTLKLLQARKRKKIAREQRIAHEEAEAARAEAEAAEAKAEAEAEAAEREQRQAKRRAEREQRRKDEEAAIAAEVAADLAEEERNRKALKERERLRAQEAYEHRNRLIGGVESISASNGTNFSDASQQGSTSKFAHSSHLGTGVTTPVHGSQPPSSNEYPAVAPEVETRSDGILSRTLPKLTRTHGNISSVMHATVNANIDDVPMLDSVDDDIDTAASTLSLKHTLTTPASLEKTHKNRRARDPMSIQKPRARLVVSPIEGQGDSDDGDDGYPNCSNCAAPMSKGNCHRKYLQRTNPPPICTKCYKFLWRTGTDRPVDKSSASRPILKLAEDGPGDDVDNEPTSADNTSAIHQTDDDGHPQCNNCNVAIPKRLRHWKSADDRLCGPCYDYHRYHEVDRPVGQQMIPLSCGNCGMLPPKRLRRLSLKDHLLCDRCYLYRVKNNADRPLDHHENIEDGAADDSFAYTPNPVEENKKAGIGFVYHLGKQNKCLTAQCLYCGWSHAQNSTLENQHRRECSKSSPSKKAPDIAANAVPDQSYTRTYQGRFHESNIQHDIGDGDNQMLGGHLFETSGVDETQLDAQQGGTSADFKYFQEERNKCLTVQCTHCGWERASNPVRERQHRRECSKGRAVRRAKNGVAHMAHDVVSLQSLQQKLNASVQDQTAREASTNSSIAAGLKAAKILAAKAVSKASAPAPNSIAPDEIQVLFYQPLPRLGETNDAANGAVSLPIYDNDRDDAGPRLVKPKMPNEEEKAAAIARMRAQGIEVISVDDTDSVSDTCWSDSDILESSSSSFQPVSLLQGARHQEEPDPRRWVDEIEDHKSQTFDIEVARKKIQARPGLKANVKTRKNGTKPGKLLAMSDWRSRLLEHGSFHRETDHNPGPQKLGTFTREVADRTKLTIQRGFDDQEIMKEEVEGTMQEFLGLPTWMKYDLTDANRLVAARTLAFSDAAGRGRVQDKDKFPVGR